MMARRLMSNASYCVADAETGIPMRRIILWMLFATVGVRIVLAIGGGELAALDHRPVWTVIMGTGQTRLVRSALPRRPVCMLSTMSRCGRPTGAISGGGAMPSTLLVAGPALE